MSSAVTAIALFNDVFLHIVFLSAPKLDLFELLLDTDLSGCPYK